MDEYFIEQTPEDIGKVMDELFKDCTVEWESRKKGIKNLSDLQFEAIRGAFEILAWVLGIEVMGGPGPEPLIPVN